MRARDRFHAWATPVLLLIILSLLIALGVKFHVLTRSAIRANKDWIPAASSAVSAASVLVTAVFAYFRFFRGRTFARRIDLAVEAAVLTGPHGHSLHTILVRARNIGTIPIWNPQVQVEVIETSGTRKATPRTLQAVYEVAGPSPSLRHTTNVLDSAEMADFACQTTISPDVWAVTYRVTLRSAGGDAWSTVHAVNAHDAERMAPVSRKSPWRWNTSQLFRR